MEFGVLVFITIVVVSVVWFRFKINAGVPERSILLRNSEHEASSFLNSNPKDGSFLVFLTSDVGKDGGASCAQISVENSIAGIDHVLNAEIQANLEQAFRKFAMEQNLNVSYQEENGMSYLRIEPSDPAGLVVNLLKTVYGQNETASIKVFGELEK